MSVRRITPFLWFDHQAEQAANFYASIFPHSQVVKVVRSGKAGAAMTVEFELEGQRFIALNGGPHFKFTEAVSFVVHCQGQDEVDYYWEKLTAGGSESQCGWLKDQFGLSWQIIPKEFNDLLSGPDPEKSARVMKAMMSMKKLDIRALQQAADNR